MNTKIIIGMPIDIKQKRIDRIAEAINIKFTDPFKPVRYIIDVLPNGEKVYFDKPGKEFTNRKTRINPHDMAPDVGNKFTKFSFSDIWATLCKIMNSISLDNYKKLSVILYRVAYLLDFEYISQGKLRYRPNDVIQKEIEDIQAELDKSKANINVLELIHFIDILAWNEDVKYHVHNNVPDFSDKPKVGRINTILSCLSIPILFQQFVDEVIKNKNNLSKIDFSIIVNVAQTFARTRGVHPLSNKKLIELLSPYLTD